MRELERKRKLVATVAGIEAAAMRPLPVLRDLTDLLPTDAWLTTASFDQKGVELTGQAAAASALIPVLENSPRLERVEFASPVTRGRDKEQFRIRAAWEVAPVAATSAAVPPAPTPGSLAPGGRPAPIPIVGTGTDSVIMRATASGTHSSTIAKQPASASAMASSVSAWAASSSLPPAPVPSRAARAAAPAPALRRPARARP